MGIVSPRYPNPEEVPTGFADDRATRASTPPPLKGAAPRCARSCRCMPARSQRSKGLLIGYRELRIRHMNRVIDGYLYGLDR